MVRWIGIGLIGLLGGISSGLFGVGGGAIFVPLLVLFFQVNPHLAIGTSLIAIVPTALVAASRNLLAGSVDLKMALTLAVFASIGAWIGSGISLQLDLVILRKLFAAFLFIIALRLFFTS